MPGLHAVVTCLRSPSTNERNVAKSPRIPGCTPTMKPAPLGTRHGRSWRPLFLFRLALYPSAREKKERAVGPFHSPGDPGRSLGPDRSEENGITFPAVFPGRSGLLTFRLSLMQVTLWKSTWDIRWWQLRSAQPAAIRANWKLECWYMYNMVSSVGNTVFLFFFSFLFFFLFSFLTCGLRYMTGRMIGVFLSFYIIRDNALTHNPGWSRMACSEPVKCRRVPRLNQSNITNIIKTQHPIIH